MPMEKWLHAPKPKYFKRLEFANENLEDLIPFIDWNYFYLSWNVQANTEIAKDLKTDALKVLDEIVQNRLTETRAVVSFFKVRRIGDSLNVLSPSACSCCPSKVLTRIHFLRMQESLNNEPLLSLADYFSPYEEDYIGLFALSSAFGIENAIKKAEGDDYKALLYSTLAIRLTEAYAEKLHRDVMQKWWGYTSAVSGIRPVPGYPTCPDHSEIRTVWNLLNPETVGLSMTENNMMIPEASVCGYYIAHPKSKYFTIKHIGTDQLEDYAKRKSWSISFAKKELARLL